MISLQWQTIAEAATGRILNSLPEGVLIALFAGTMLRLLPRQNSGTRFAVWFVALLGVAALPMAAVPLFGGIASGRSVVAAKGLRPLMALPGSFALVLFLAWIVGASVAMIRLGSGLWRLRMLRKGCLPIDGANLDPAVRQVLADFSSSRSVAVGTSQHISVPAAVGFFKPIIVIPVWALRELSPSELNIILLHEFAHLRRRDAWTNLFQKILRAVFLFHPAVWWIERRISLEREMACDDQVLAETANPHGYAKCLIELLEKTVARRNWTMAQAVVHRAGEASMRLAQILDVTRPDGKRIWKPALGFVVSFFVLCLAAVPRAPRLVAFERNMPAFQADNHHPAISSQSQIFAPAVIPAALRTHSSHAPGRAMQRTWLMAMRRIPERLPKHRTDAPRVLAVRFSTETEGSADSARVRADQSIEPISQTLLIIRTAQQIGPNSWVLSVGVWRVNLVNSLPEIAGKSQTAKKT
jgi:beta-lactamase regulating signal transducer with metallopeptidase domain